MDYSLIYDVPEICAAHGIHEVVISPGSRSAPLTLAFSRHPAFNPKIIIDERSAGFIALGLAIRQKNPVILICTSGTATLNFSPAVAEAYFQQIPLLLFTADRPPEWIDQQDGQTIRQKGLYGNHVKNFFQAPDSFTLPDLRWYLHRIISEAVLLCKGFPSGPVHVNFPFREPFYPDDAAPNINRTIPKVIRKVSAEKSLTQIDKIELSQKLKEYKKILIIAGQNLPDQELTATFKILYFTKNIPVVCESISNLNGGGFIDLPDGILIQKSTTDFLNPELLISYGLSVTSKSLKNFLRKNPPLEHWHVQPFGTVADSFQSLTLHIEAEPIG